MRQSITTGYANDPFGCINAIAAYSGLLVLNVILLITFIRSYRHPRTSTYRLADASSGSFQKKTTILLLCYMVVSLISCISHVIKHTVMYVDTIQTTDTVLVLREHTLRCLFMYSNAVGWIAQCTYLILIGFCLKLILKDIYADKFFEMNKLKINILFVVYVISTLARSIVVSMIDFNLLSLKNLIAWLQWCIVSIIYYVVILIMYNKKLRKFLYLTTNTNRQLSFSINEKFTTLIMKQANLITICIIMILLDATCHEIYVELKLSFVAYWGLFVTNGSMLICIYLLCDFNLHQYNLLCKYCDICCLKIRQTNIVPQSNYTHFIQTPLMSVQQKSVTAGQTYIFFDNHAKLDPIPTECLEGNQCTIVKTMCKILMQSNEYNMNESMSKYSPSKITDDFDHMLQYHDSEKEFDAIHGLLNTKTHVHANGNDCPIYNRHTLRRRNINTNVRTDTNERNFKTNNVLDKIHTFYYHSYNNSVNSFENEEINSEDNGYNKFNSNLDHQLNANNVINDVYSFGQRFEYRMNYETETKQEWFIEPIYSSFKDELLKNKMCNISNDIYNHEYNKCKVFMKCKRWKILNNRNIRRELSFEHIFSLLIYCNCTKYQYKWSETFRKIPNDETDESLKRRHSYFYFSSKYLTTLVEEFGSKLIDSNNKNTPFYHGVSAIVFFDRTITQFYGPLSTSKSFNVASHFSNGVGIILQLKYSFSAYPLNAKYIDCSYWSDFASEKECLFIGGIPMLIITNIIEVSNGKIYKKYINALNIINCILNGTFNNSKHNNNTHDINKNSTKLCCQLLMNQLEDNKTLFEVDIIPEYVVTLTHKYYNNLNHIVIFWEHLNGLLLTELKELFVEPNLPFFDLNILCRLFPNIEQIEYFNESLKKNKPTSRNKIIKKIVNYIMINMSNNIFFKLKYIIIHHKASITFRRYSSNFLGNTTKIILRKYKIYQDDKRVIVYKANHKSEFDASSINIRFDEINQGNVTQNMLVNRRILF